MEEMRSARVECIADDEPRIVDAGVRIRKPSMEARLQRRAVTRRVEIDAERFRQRHAPAEVIVEEETGADHPCRTQVRLVRQHEQQRLDDVRCRA